MELKAVGENFLSKKDAKEMPKKKALLSSFLAARSIDEAQFSSFLGGFRQALNPAKEGTACILAEVLLVSTVASGQFKGGRPAGRWFLAAASANSNSSVRAWNTHHKLKASCIVVFSILRGPTLATGRRDSRTPLQASPGWRRCVRLSPRKFVNASC